MPRRRLLFLSGWALAQAAAVPPLWAAIDVARAAAFIEATGNELIATINDSQLDLPQRRAQVAAILRRAVDIEGTARFVLGRHIRQARPEELSEYLRLFDEIIIRNLSARFGEYRGVRFSLGRSQQRAEDDVLVTTVIERPGHPPFALDWRVTEIGGQPKVVDVIAEGTSLRLTTRSEYSAVIQRHGGRFSALLEAMRNQIAELSAREGRG